MESAVSNRSFEFFLQFHHGVPRQGPGSPEATIDAFRRIQKLLPPEPRMLDLGCGSGGQTVTLASLTTGSILAIDNYPPFVEELRRRVVEHGLSDRVTAQVGDMNALELPPRSLDLVWCEGALFVAGFDRGLRIIHDLLRSEGLTVVSEAAWLKPTEEVPRDVLEFWTESYPAMTDVEGNRAMARKAGFEVLDHFTLAADDRVHRPGREADERGALEALRGPGRRESRGGGAARVRGVPQEPRLVRLRVLPAEEALRSQS